MKLLTPAILKYLPDWNKRVHFESDALAFCAANDVIAIETDLITDLGEYRLHREKPFILINKFLEARHRAWVYFHEIGHFILHPTTCAKFSDAVTKRKIEREAHFVAAVALLPQYVLNTKNLCEIQDEFSFPRRLILLRKEIYDTYKI